MSVIYDPYVDEVFTEDQQDQSIVQTLLHDLFRLQEERPTVFQGSTYRVTKRNANEAARYQRLLSWAGPEAATVDFMRSVNEEWFADPEKFWKPPEVSAMWAPRSECSLVLIFHCAKRCGL